tara:strand:+ start:882 stop:1460 length:579 start_codon:yes stop_codon:yes gene_type:complete
LNPFGVDRCHARVPATFFDARICGMIDSISRRPFRFLGMLFLAAATLLVLLGAWTFTFTETRGELIEFADADMMMSGGYSGVPFVHRRSSHTSTLAVTYRYRAEGNQMTGTRIGMGLAPWTLSPFGQMRWERYARTGAELTVYHAPGLPGISVLHRGLDVVSIVILAVVGISLLKFSAWLARHQHLNSDSDR